VKKHERTQLLKNKDNSLQNHVQNDQHSPDCHFFVAYRKNKFLHQNSAYLIQSTTGNVVAEFDHGNKVNSVEFNSVGSLLLITGGNQVSVWEIPVQKDKSNEIK